MNSSPIIIIGAGPAGLMAAHELADAGKKVVIYDQNKAPARKFLVAGNGGFNLTHSENIADFVSRYSATQLADIIKSFDNQQTIEWLKGIGIETFVGSSGKIFPLKSIKPIQVLQAWLEKLNNLEVKLNLEHQFIGFNSEEVQLIHKGKTISQPYSKLILAMGGGSWQKTGSDAKWIPILKEKNIEIAELQSANSGYNTTSDFSFLEGKILKNIEVHYKNTNKKGELVFTKYGIEGSSIYYLNRFTRDHTFPLHIYIDLKPSLSNSEVHKQLIKGVSVSQNLKEKLKLSSTAVALLKTLNKNIFTNPQLLAEKIKCFPIEVKSLRPIDEVISTAGGVKFQELNTDLSLKNYPNIYCIGEMVDWEAPTGGYLLQACFSMGSWVGKSILKGLTNK